MLSKVLGTQGSITATSGASGPSSADGSVGLWSDFSRVLLDASRSSRGLPTAIPRPSDGPEPDAEPAPAQLPSADFPAIADMASALIPGIPRAPEETVAANAIQQVTVTAMIPTVVRPRDGHTTLHASSVALQPRTLFTPDAAIDEDIARHVAAATEDAAGVPQASHTHASTPPRRTDETARASGTTVPVQGNSATDAEAVALLADTGSNKPAVADNESNPRQTPATQIPQESFAGRRPILAPPPDAGAEVFAVMPDRGSSAGSVTRASAASDPPTVDRQDVHGITLPAPADEAAIDTPATTFRQASMGASRRPAAVFHEDFLNCGPVPPLSGFVASGPSLQQAAHTHHTPTEQVPDSKIAGKVRPAGLGTPELQSEFVRPSDSIPTARQPAAAETTSRPTGPTPVVSPPHPDRSEAVASTPNGDTPAGAVQRPPQNKLATPRADAAESSPAATPASHIDPDAKRKGIEVAHQGDSAPAPTASARHPEERDITPRSSRLQTATSNPDVHAPFAEVPRPSRHELATPRADAAESSPAATPASHTEPPIVGQEPSLTPNAFAPALSLSHSPHASQESALTASGASAPGGTPTAPDGVSEPSRPSAQQAEQIARAIADRVIQNAQHGRLDVRLRLSPDHLGTIDIQLSLRDKAMEATFHVEQPATHQLLSETLPVLRHSLHQSGISFAFLHLQLSDNHNSGNFLTHQHRFSNPAQPLNRRASTQMPDPSASDAPSLVARIDSQGRWDILA